MPDCCFAHAVYYDGAQYGSDYDYYEPSWCLFILIVVILILIYCWLRPVPSAADRDDIAKDVDTELASLQTRLTAAGATNVQYALDEARMIARRVIGG